MDERLKEISDLCKRAGAWPICWPNVPVLELDRCSYAAHRLAGLRDEFKAGDPLALAEAVRLTWEEDFYLPHWTHGVLAEAFNEFVIAEGNKSLDVLLKLNRGRGRNNNPFKRRDKRGLDNEIVFHVCTLNEYLNFSLPVTYLILSKKQIKYDDGHKELATTLSFDRIQEIYKGAPCKFTMEELNDCFGNSIEERLDCFMTNYADIFSNLCDAGTLQGKELSSAMRSFRALFPKIEPLSLPAAEN